MRLLVTGGAGFIGSNFIRYWLKNHPKDVIVNFDKLTYAGHISSTKDFSNNPNYTFIQGDICDSDSVNKSMHNIDVIVHFAAESHVDRSIRNSSVFLNTNILGTHTLLEAALKHQVARFHHVSTDEVFGVLEDPQGKFQDTTPYAPRNPYSASKAGSDHLVRSYFHTHNLPITITNCSNNFGPYQDPEKFLPRMITNIIEDKKVPIYGDGKYIRDWLFVDDHSRAIDLVLRGGSPGNTYLVGGQSEDITNLEIAQLVLKLMGKNENYLEFVKDRPGHDRRYSIDWSTIKLELKWKPEHDFEVWLSKTVDWYKTNKWWWKPLKKTSESFYQKK